MFSCIGQRREEGWSVVEARPRTDSLFPQVFLEGIFDIVKAEMEQTMVYTRRNLWNRPPGPWSVLQWWKDALKSMMLVHSSWHACARRLLGFAVVSNGPTSYVVLNPLFGRWTKELHLSYSEGVSLDSPILPDER